MIGGANARHVLQCAMSTMRNVKEAGAICSSTQPGTALAVLGDFLNQLDDRPAQAIVIDARECLQQPIGMRLGELVKDRLLVGVRHLVTALEQGGDRHAQENGDLQQSPAANAIGPLLVFLDLLERQIELIRKLSLSEPLLQTIDSDVAADNPVDRVRSLATHHNLSCPQQRKAPWTIDMRVQE